MKYDNKPIERLPTAVRRFVQKYDEVTVNEMPEESIRWGVHSPAGETQFHMHEFSDEDGVDVTFEVQQKGIRIFGYIDPSTFILQDVEIAPLSTGVPADKSLRFTFHRGNSIDVAISFDDDGIPVIQILG